MSMGNSAYPHYFNHDFYGGNGGTVTFRLLEDASNVGVYMQSDGYNNTLNFGNASAMTATPIMSILRTGRVGLNDLAPGAMFEVTSNVASDAVTLAVSSQTGSAGNIFVIQGGGNVAIGDNTPDAMFEVQAQAAIAPTSPVVQISSANGTGIFSVNASGNVGIGVSSPLTPLHVHDTTYTGLRITDTDVDDTAKYGQFSASQYDSGTESEGFLGIGMNSTSASLNNVLIGGGYSNLNAATSIDFYTAENTTTRTGTSRIKIISSGNVGIGSSNPATKLHVSSGVITVDGTGGMFAGNGSSITAVTIFTSSEAVNNTSIATATDIGLATATIVNRGGRIQWCEAHMTLVNAAGAERIYTYSLYKNGVKVSEGDYVQTCSGTSSEFAEYGYHEASSTAGSVTYGLIIKSSSATGTQTVKHADVVCFEY
jgi:hypothetical protein